MIPLNFIYNGKDINLQCSKDDNMKKILDEFSSKTGLDLEKENIYYKNKLINKCFSDLKLEQMINLEENNTKQINLIVLDKSDLNSSQKLKKNLNNEYLIEFKYKDIKHKIKYKPNETIENIFNKFAEEIKYNIKNLIFLYEGKIIENYKLDINQIINTSKNFDNNNTLYIDVDDNREDIAINIYQNEFCSINNENINRYKVIFQYHEKTKEIICNENDCMLKIYNEFLNQIEKDKNEIYCLYNGEKIRDYNITFNKMI